MESENRFSTAIGRIDAANAEGPPAAGPVGPSISGELLYSRRMSGWLDRLFPEASEPLRIAARAQHIRRWEVPRSTQAMDRAGYHRWRTGLYTFHANAAAEIMAAVGYDVGSIARVRSLLKKERLKADPDMQALEDVICVVFLENYFAAFAPKHEPEKVIAILRRTWAKMSPVGHAAALKLAMPPEAAELVKQALS